MGFRDKLRHAPNNRSDGEHLPAFIPAECLGQACPNYTGTPCDNTEMEWLSAGGPTEGRDKSKPPLRDEATYIIYGQRCLSGVKPKLVAQRAEILKPAEVNPMMLIAMTGRYGDMPVSIVGGSNLVSLEDIAYSYDELTPRPQSDDSGTQH